jgi:hypothetical protein
LYAKPTVRWMTVFNNSASSIHPFGCSFAIDLGITIPVFFQN